MALATYSDLKQAVANYLARTDLTDLIPTFIALGEVRFNRELKLRASLKRSITTTVNATNTPSEFVLFPTDYNQIKSVTITGTPNRLLDFIPASQFPGLSGSSEVGKPSFFTVLGNQIRLGPTPDAAYTMELVYYSNFGALSDSNTSNWVMANAPDIYLYATLIEAEPYLMNDARVQLWKSLYDESIQKISNNDDAGEFGAGALGMRSTYLVTR